MVTYYRLLQKKGIGEMPQVIDIQKTGAHLKELCRQHGIAVSDIQKLLYLKCPQSIYLWFKGETLPTVDHLIVLAHRMKLPVEELIVLKDESVTEEHIADMIRWTGEKAKDSDLLRKTYWEVLGVLILD